MFPFDLAVATWIVESRTDAGIAFFSISTRLGDVWFSLFAAGLICLFLYGTNEKRYVPELFLAALGSAISVWALKIFFALPRPLEPIALLAVDSFSFPSGHAAAAMTLYGFLFWMIVEIEKVTSRYVWGAVLATTILCVGFSRLYLGVHYLSDVLAGYAIGAIWIAIGITLARRK